MRNNPQQQIRRLFASTGAPVTIILIAFNVVAFFWGGIAAASTPFHHLVFNAALWPQQLWTILTWPLAGGGDPITVLFVCAWTFWIGGSLERGWGSRDFLIFFAATSALTAISLWVGCVLLHQPWLGLAGLYIAIAPATVAWCVINAREVIRLYGILPIPAPWLLALTLVLVWYRVGAGVIGLFGLVSCGAAYLYVRYGRYAYRGYSSARPKVPDLRLSDPDRVASRGPFGWFRARREQRKLEKLWKNSMDNQGKDD